MHIDQYLIISQGKRRYSPNVKLVKTLKGNMPSNAVALKLNIQIPDSIFKRPQLEASIKIDENDIRKPMINAVVMDNIREVFQQQLGVDVTIQHVEPDMEHVNYNMEVKKYLKESKK